MSTNEKYSPTPHEVEVDLSPMEGSTVLGEPLPLLFSALLRLRFGLPRSGMTEVSATWPRHEAEAVSRAMERIVPAIPEDSRTQGQRDCDRFMAVARRVCEVVDSLTDGGDRGAA